jgi:hypothetical protein
VEKLSECYKHPVDKPVDFPALLIRFGIVETIEIVGYSLAGGDNLPAKMVNLSDLSAKRY